MAGGSDAAETVGPEWVRLGELLMQRRVALGFRERTKFIDARPALSTAGRTVFDIENGKRDNYGAPMLAAIEVAYEWEEGSIRDVLAGGNPRPRETGAEGLVYQRPAGLSDEDWAAIKRKLDEDWQFYIQSRRREGP